MVVQLCLIEHKVDVMIGHTISIFADALQIVQVIVHIAQAIQQLPLATTHASYRHITLLFAILVHTPHAKIH